MPNKIKTTPEDLIPSDDTNIKSELEQEINNAKEIFDKAREEAKKENKTNSTTNKKTTKKSKSTTKKTLTPKEIQEQGEPIPVLKNGKVDMSEKHNVVNDMKLQFNNVISNMKIDLNNIVLSDSLTSMEKHTNTDIVFNSKPVFEVALAQSCYTVFLNSLKYSDIDAIKQSTADEYHTLLVLYHIIHDRMQATTVGKLDFETFIECTTMFDLQSLLYGLHCQTFPGTTKFDFKCIHCGHQFSQEIPNNNLLFVKNDKTFERLNEVRLKADSPKYIIENSLLSEDFRICLEQSKTIIDIRIPSLKDQLNILKNVPSDKIDDDKYQENLSVLLFIKNMYMLNVPETLQKNSPVYYPIVSDSSKISVLEQLSINDSVQLSNALEDWSDKYKIEYKIPSFDCPSCKKTLGEMPVDMENVLFHQMLNL